MNVRRCIMLMLNIKMPLGEAVAVSLIGIVTVIIILAIIALLIVLVSKVIRSVEASFASKNTEQPAQPLAVVAEPEVELIDTDEKSAAVIMAIVSQKSGIPLERLRFKSIKYIGEDGKGESVK